MEQRAELAVAEMSGLHNTAVHEPTSVDLATVKNRRGGSSATFVFSLGGPNESSSECSPVYGSDVSLGDGGMSAILV